MESVSVIVTTYNRSSYLRLSLASIEMQTVRPHEVIIADDGSDPEHVQVIEELIARSPLRVVHVRQKHDGFRAAASRNNAVRHATGDYLFFTDGDAVLFPDVLAQHMAVAGPRCWVSGYGLRLTPGETARVTEELIRARRLEALWPGAGDPRSQSLAADAAKFRRRMRRMWLWRTERRMRRFRLITMQASMPRALFEEVNGFDEDFLGWGDEDLDLGLRLQIAGARACTVLDTSRILHLYHEALSRDTGNRALYERARRGQSVCVRGLRHVGHDTAAPCTVPADMRVPMSVDVPPPKFLFLHVNQRCNLACRHCVFWKRDDGDRASYMPRSRKCEVIREFAELSPGAAVVICGGESMLDPDEYFAISRECAHSGLRCLSVINGTQITDAAAAERVVVEGPSEVSVSLDSYIEGEHDAMRGRGGSFGMAVNAVRLLQQARTRRPELGMRLYVMALVHEENYARLDTFYDFALNELGADKLKLNFLQPTFGLGGGEDEFFARYHLRDPEALAAVIRACDAKYRLGLNPAWLEHVRMYVRSVRDNGRAHRGWRSAHGTEAHICNSYERNIMVDLRGTARLCFAPDFPGFPLVHAGDVRRFWYGFAAPIRAQMRTCNRYCAISHSVRRENATLKTAAAPRCAAGPLESHSRRPLHVRDSGDADTPIVGTGEA